MTATSEALHPNDFIALWRRLQHALACTDVAAEDQATLRQTTRARQQIGERLGAARSGSLPAGIGYDDRPGQYTGDWKENFGTMVGAGEYRDGLAEQYAETAYLEGARAASIAERGEALEWLRSLDVNALMGVLAATTAAHVNCRYYGRHLDALRAAVEARRAGTAPVSVWLD